MGKNISFLKTWWGVTKPSKTLLFLQSLTATIPAILTVVAAVPAANAITSITIADYEATAKWLCIVFIIEVFKQISWTIEYQSKINQLGYVYTRIQERLFLKIFYADDQNFKYTSKEKMINTITNNITVLSDFCDQIAYKLSYLFQAITTLVIIFSTNILIGILITFISIIVYFMINALNISIGKKSLDIQEERDNVTETFADFVEGRKLSTDLNLSANLHEKYFTKVDKLVKHYKKRKVFESLRDQWVYVFYTFIILLATLYLVRLVEQNSLTITTYLVITPYLTSAITRMKDFFAIFNDLQNANISSLRVKTLLDMSEKDMIEFGNNSTDKIDGAITFTNVSYTSENKLDKSLNSIKSFNV